ncbi:MAG: M20/M25/M40 family metallo-hydrolase [Paracoccaceae bacterium]
MTDHPTPLDGALAAADAGIDAGLARLMELVAIPSVSAEPERAGDVRRAAEWLAADLASMGFDASVRTTERHPMVVGHDTTAPEGAPHVLFYGHYDVQPADPLELWTSDPFTPALVPQPDGETWITGRGASDDKGALMTFIEACRAWKTATGALPCRVTVLLEGEEEITSPSLGPFLAETAEELRADTVLVCDTDMWDRDTPAITTMMRGLASEEFTITTADRDMHAGIFGGAARNALQLMADVLASLRAPDGSVAIDGFYGDVRELPPEVSASWTALPFDAEAFLGGVGLSIPAGEADRSVLEQVWARPTFEVHGVWGGYLGEGFKSVIPAEAHAKVSFRLVPDQDPERVREAFRDHVRARIPADCSVRFTRLGAAAPAAMPTDSPMLQQALAGLRDEWGKAAIAGTGGSIPILAEFRDRLGMDALLVGFARFDNRVHSPNEKYDLSSYVHGTRSWVRILDKFTQG